MKKFIICDSTSNTGKDYISEDDSNCEDIMSARQYNSEKEAIDQIKFKEWEKWAYVSTIDI